MVNENVFSFDSLCRCSCWLWALRKAIGGTAEEREESIKDLTAKAGANAKGMVSATWPLFFDFMKEEAGKGELPNEHISE